MLNQDICYLYDSIAVYSSYGGIVFAAEEGQNIARALGPKNKVQLSSTSSWVSSDNIRSQSFLTTGCYLLAALSTKPVSCLDC